MRCRVGDLAIVVRSHCGNEGKIVRCIEFVGKATPMNGDDYWRIDRALPCVWHKSATQAPPEPYFRDSCLRPIRGEHDPDETLLHHPVDETATS